MPDKERKLCYLLVSHSNKTSRQTLVGNMVLVREKKNAKWHILK